MQRWFFFAFFVPVLVHVGVDGYLWHKTGSIPLRLAPFMELPGWMKAWVSGVPFAMTGIAIDKFSYVNNILAGLVIAEVINRVSERKPWIKVPGWVIASALVAVLFCSYSLKIRNGNVGLVLLLVGSLLASYFVIRQRLGVMHRLVFVLTFVFTIAVTGYVLWKSDGRWKSLIETVPIAMDIKGNRAWLVDNTGVASEPLPALSSGEPVNGSNYLRMAWARVSVELVQRYPLGVGADRNAVFDTIDREMGNLGKYSGGHSHSGILDFTVANGIPGLIMWLAFLALVIQIGWKGFARGQVTVGLILVMLTLGFLTRSVVDSNLRDHSLQEFLFLIGLFANLLPLEGVNRTDSDSGSGAG